MPSKVEAELKYDWCLKEIKKHFGDVNVECSVAENDTVAIITVFNGNKKTSLVVEWQPMERINGVEKVKGLPSMFDDEIKNRKVLDNWISEVKEMWGMK